MEMNQSFKYLPRRNSESDYAELRAFMLDKVQAMSGHEWTDYNLHDPGVTILEQLCYALTDINYRSDYPVKDLLVEEDGLFDLHNHGMYTRDEALPCRPLTIHDYQKYLVDKFSDISYLLLEPAKPAKTNGYSSKFSCIYDLSIKMKQKQGQYSPCEIISTNADEQECLRNKIIQEFNKVRNLGEDINKITFIQEKPAELVATIEIDDTRPVVNILCDIYFEIEKILSGSIYRLDIKSQDTSKNISSDIYTGPLLRSGFIEDKEVEKATENISLSNIVTLVKNIAGVKKIKSIVIIANDEVFTDYIPPLNEICHRLTIPHDSQELKVKLIRNGKEEVINLTEFISAYEMLLQKDSHNQLSLALDLDSGVISNIKQSLSEYISVQAQFPDVYGINRFGVPPYYPEERKAKAMQLKGYLMLFDQIMSDHLSMLDNVKNLFSINIDAVSSYKTQALKSESIPNIERLYKTEPDNEYLANNKKYEDYPERKGRIFDYILAMNGRDKEEYGYEYKNAYFSEHELEQILLENKYKYINDIHGISANRAGAYDYTKASWGKNNVSTIERLLSNIIGFDSRCRSFVYPLIKNNMRFYYDDKEHSHLYFSEDKEGEYTAELVNYFYKDIDIKDINAQQHNFIRIPFINSIPDQNNDPFNIIKPGLTEKESRLGKSVLRNGIDLESYRVGHVNDKSSYELLYNIASDINSPAEWQYIASFKSIKEAFIAANKLRYSLVELNLEMEGMHLIEHNLLLPIDQDGIKVFESINNIGFYTHQISIILSDWTARFNDSNYRLYVENLIRNECPAHIHVNIYWLNYADMEKFEILFKNWLNCKMEMKSIQKLNILSDRLSVLLQSFYKEAIK